MLQNPGNKHANAVGAASNAAAPNVDMVKRPRVDGAGGEQVASVIANMNPGEVYHIVQQTKQIVDSNPEQVQVEKCQDVVSQFLKARALLISNPQLAYAVLQAQVLLGMAPQLLQAARSEQMSDSLFLFF